MHDSLFVHMLQCTSYLLHKAPNGWLIELKVIAFFFLDKFFEVAFFSPLGDYDQLIIVDEGIDVLDDMRVVQFFHYIDFSQTFFTLPLISHIENLKLHI